MLLQSSPKPRRLPTSSVEAEGIPRPLTIRVSNRYETTNKPSRQDEALRGPRTIPTHSRSFTVAEWFADLYRSSQSLEHSHAHRERVDTLFIVARSKAHETRLGNEQRFHCF